MDRHNGFNAPEEHIPLKFIFQIDRDQTGLPVMAVDDIRFKADQRQHG